MLRRRMLSIMGTSPAVGLLGLEPHTRRRNRANGRVRLLHDGGFEVQVLQSFGNCPKYIHARRPEPLPSLRAGPARRPPAWCGRSSRRTIGTSAT